MPPRTPHTIADRIRWAVQSLGITQTAYAESVGMSPSQLSAMLRRLDERPYAIELETVLRLAHAGHVTPRWLLLGEGDPAQRGDYVERAQYPTLSANPNLHRHALALNRQGFRINDELLGWIGQVVLPLEHPDELTPFTVATLAKLRLHMQYGRTLGGLEDVETSYDSPPRAARRRPASAKTPAPTPKARVKKPAPKGGGRH